MSKIVYLAHDDTPSVTFAIGPTRYVYGLPNPAILDTVLYLIRRVSIGRAFAHAKRCGKLMETV